MRILDCDMRYGADCSGKYLSGCPSIEALAREMDRAGVTGGLVHRIEEEVSLGDVGPLLLKDVANEPRVWAAATLLPTHTGEFPAPEALEGTLRAGRVKALRLSPGIHRYLLSRAAIGDTLCEAQRLRVPIVADTSCGLTLENVEAILADFPALRLILIYANCWPSARLLYPFLASYEHVYLSLTHYFTQDGIEDAFARYGAGRLLYGSGFPASHFGSNLLMVAHARIPSSAREAIFGDNLAALLEEAP